MSLEVRVLPFNQNGKIGYVGVAKVSDLIGSYQVDIWSPENPSGYQRAVSKPRARQFGRFMAKGGMSPTTILINVRNDSLRERNGVIKIPSNTPVWLVDGQHRVVGLDEVKDDYPDVLDLELPVVITNSHDSLAEAFDFLIFNKTHKGVRPDLAERIIQQAVETHGMDKLTQDREQGSLPRAILSDLEWRPKATNIVDLLNENPKSPFYEKVRFPNSPKANTVVNEISITDSLKPILKDEVLGELPPDRLAAALVNYWRAIQSLCEEAFENPDEYIIQKTAGVFSLHEVFLTVARYCRDRNGRFDLRENNIKDVLGKGAPEYFQSEYWHSQGKGGLMGSSRKAYSTIAHLIRDEISLRMEQAEMGVAVVLA